jgi:hypothetical protein
MTTVLPPQTTEKPLQDSVGRREPGRFRTTPSRLRLLSIVSVGAIVVLLIVSAGALSSRRSAANSVRDDSGAQLADVQALYHVLADLDATASRQLLAAGQPTAKVRQRYLDDRDEAGRLVARIAERAQSSPKARRALQVIATQLPLYSQKVEAGVVNSRFGFPLGAEETRQASALMRTDILPATVELYKFAADDLHDDYERGTSASQMVWIVVIGLATLAVLAVTQIYAARRTNRVLNVGLLVASVIVVVLLVWTLVRFNNEQSALVTAQRDGSDTVQVLSSARILALQSQANANLRLAERGTGDVYRAAYVDLVKKLCGGRECRGGTLGYAHQLAARTGTEAQITGIQDDATNFQSVVEQVVSEDENAEYARAVALAVGEQAAAAQALDTSIAAETAEAQVRFDAAADDARGGFAVLAIALTLGLLLAAVLVLVGLQPRIAEYR